MKTSLCLLLFILGMTTYSIGQTTASISTAYAKGKKHYESPKNLQVINFHFDYSPFRVEKILQKFSNQLIEVDTEMTFYLISEEWTTDAIKKEIRNEMETLTGNKSILYLVRDRRGHNTECMLALSKDMDRKTRKQLEKIDACTRLNE